MSTCHTPPPDRKQLIKRVGQKLVQRHGKRPTYTQPQIQSAAGSCGYPIDWHCWAYCIFMSQDSFDSYHTTLGEACDYMDMKGTMLASLGESGSLLPDLNLSWIEWPDMGIDLSGVFDAFGGLDV